MKFLIEISHLLRPQRCKSDDFLKSSYITASAYNVYCQSNNTPLRKFMLKCMSLTVTVSLASPVIAAYC